MEVLHDVLARVDADLSTSLRRLFELLQIPSISTDPEYRGSCRTAAEWLSSELTTIGLDASVGPTSGNSTRPGSSGGRGWSDAWRQVVESRTVPSAVGSPGYKLVANS